LTGAVQIVAVLAGVDLTLGPLVTLLIASPKKPRRELARDITIIATVQIIALLYGSATLWRGRPLYYTFSSDRLEMVQASDLSAAEIELARNENPDFGPHWWSLPRWVWARLPDDPVERSRITLAAVTGDGPDVIQMPRYFKPWAQAAQELRKQLLTVDQVRGFSKGQRRELKAQMAALGVAADQANSTFLISHGLTLLAVFDPNTAQVRAILRAD
jgi:hypothetical protein